MLLALGFLCSPCPAAYADQAMPCCLHHEGRTLVCDGGGRLASLDSPAEATSASLVSAAPPADLAAPRLLVSALPADLSGAPAESTASGAELVLLHQTLLR